MQTTFLKYHNESWNVALQNRWLGSVNLKTSDNALNGNYQNYVDSSLDAYDVVDITIVKEFEFGESDVDAFLTVNNLLDERAPLFGSDSGLPGLFYPTLGPLRRHGPLLHRRRQDEADMKTQARILMAVLGSVACLSLLSTVAAADPSASSQRSGGSQLPPGEIIPSDIYDPLGLVSEARPARQSRERLRFH